VNLTGPASEGHPAEIIDTTHAMMFVTAYDLITRDHDLGPGLYAIPDRLDRDVAERKLETLDIDIDAVTQAQEAYADDWRNEGSSF
jgi:adenosylhomocysteinase